jgi:hypothetical protein
VQITEFSRGRLYVVLDQREVVVPGEMVLDPLGFVVFDDIALRWGDDRSVLTNHDRHRLFAGLQDAFISKDRKIWFRSTLIRD